MGNFKSVLLLGILLTSVPYAGAAETSIMVESDQCVVQVKGVVCSFCAYGTEKNLSKLTFLNPSYFGNGVLMDIHANRITLALSPGEPLDLKSIHGAIKKGGYDPITVHLRIAGPLEKKDGRTLITHTQNGQVFELTGSELDQLAGKQSVDVQGYLNVEKIPSFQDTEVIPVILEKVLADS